MKENHHHIRISAAAKADLKWWVKGLDIFHGSTPFTCDIALPSYQFSTDACLLGGGAVFAGDWFYASWSMDFPEIQHSHINVLELQTVLLAARRWGHLWTGKHVVVRSDNTVSVAAVNNGTSRSLEILDIVQNLFWTSVKFGFKLSANYIPGRLNVVSDRLSRIHDPLAACEFQQLIVVEWC